MSRTQDFESKVFKKDALKLPNGETESVVRGGRDLLPLLPKAFEGIKQIGVIGWGSQGPAQAQNLRDSLEGTQHQGRGRSAEGQQLGQGGARSRLHRRDRHARRDVRRDPRERPGARADQRRRQSTEYSKIFEAIKPGATLGLSHGYLLGHLKNEGKTFPKNINVMMVAPKGMGPSVRRLYVQGKTENGAGINASFAVQQDVNGKAVDYALGWSVGLGSPYTFQTTLESEYKSDIFGERCILLGAVHGLVEGLYRRCVAQGVSKEDAFKRSAESITGPISKTISHKGIMAVYDGLDAEGKAEFETRVQGRVSRRARDHRRDLTTRSSSGNEIRSVNLAGERLKRYPMGNIDETAMWKVGERVRAERVESKIPLDPFTAGAYVATMMAQIDELDEKGHPYSEIANESVIECTDSLNPYMHARGVAYMVDNCSITARLGSRKWAPALRLPDRSGRLRRASTRSAKLDDSLIEKFKSHVIHPVLAEVGKMRPSVDISVHLSSLAPTPRARARTRTRSLDLQWRRTSIRAHVRSQIDTGTGTGTRTTQKRGSCARR